MKNRDADGEKDSEGKIDSMGEVINSQSEMGV